MTPLFPLRSRRKQECLTTPFSLSPLRYWGKASIPLNTPINPSVSVTLDQADLRAVTSCVASPNFPTDRLWLNGEEVDVVSSKRFRACVDGVKALSPPSFSSHKVHVSSMNTFPTAAGLASSAAGYAALVACLAETFGAKETFPGELTTIARQGSGSACRSMYGGFVAWRMGGARADATDSKAEQVCPESHWPELRAVILVVSDEKKDTSSTQGMSTSVETSELLGHRAGSGLVDRRMAEIEGAFKRRDFGKFAEVTMKDSNQVSA